MYSVFFNVPCLLFLSLLELGLLMNRADAYVLSGVPVVSVRRGHPCPLKIGAPSGMPALELGWLLVEDDVGVVEPLIFPLDSDVFGMFQFVEISAQMPVADPHVGGHPLLPGEAVVFLPGIHEQKGVGQARTDGQSAVAHDQVRQGGKACLHQLVLNDDAIQPLFEKLPYSVHCSFRVRSPISGVPSPRIYRE